MHTIRKDVLRNMHEDFLRVGHKDFAGCRSNGSFKVFNILNMEGYENTFSIQTDFWRISRTDSLRSVDLRDFNVS